MTTFGEKYTDKDLQEFFKSVPIEENKMDCKYICDMLTGKIDE